MFMWLLGSHTNILIGLIYFACPVGGAFLGTLRNYSEKPFYKMPLGDSLWVMHMMKLSAI